VPGLGPGRTTREFIVFISSGDDVLEQRRAAEAGINAKSRRLRQANAPIRFQADRWEHRPAGRNPIGHPGNAVFVRRAKAADATLALLLEDVGGGTEEELNAVLDETDRDLAVLWYVGRTESPACGARAWLLNRKDEIVWDRVGRPGTATNAEGLEAVLDGWIYEALLRSSDYSEDR